MKWFTLLFFICFDLLLVLRNYKNCRIYGSLFKGVVHIPYLISIPFRVSLIAVSLGIIKFGYNITFENAIFIWVIAIGYSAILTGIIDCFYAR